MKEDQEKKPETNQELVSDLAEKLLRALGHNLESASFKDTPSRFAKFMLTFSELTKEEPKFTVFPAHSTGLIVIKDLEVRSMCAHHLAPFFGKCTIAYYPKEVIAGLSKPQRTIDYLSMVPTEQETLTKKIHDYLQERLKPVGLFVSLECQHTCMIVRGVQTSGSLTQTIETSGVLSGREIGFK